MKNQEYQLLIDLKKSNKLALKKLFFNYHDTLFRFTYYRISEYDLAEDIVQETFIRVWKNRNLIDPEKSFFSYIAKISTNLCLDHFRHQKVRKKHKDTIPKYGESHYYNPETEINLEILQEKIKIIANKKLPEKCREIFILSRLENKKNAEIAHLLKISKRTVENQLYRALKILKNNLKDFFE